MAVDCGMAAEMGVLLVAVGRGAARVRAAAEGLRTGLRAAAVRSGGLRESVAELSSSRAEDAQNYTAQTAIGTGGGAEGGRAGGGEGVSAALQAFLDGHVDSGRA